MEKKLRWKDERYIVIKTRQNEYICEKIHFVQKNSFEYQDGKSLIQNCVCVCSHSIDNRSTDNYHHLIHRIKCTKKKQNSEEQRLYIGMHQRKKIFISCQWEIGNHINQMINNENNEKTFRINKKKTRMTIMKYISNQDYWTKKKAPIHLHLSTWCLKFKKKTHTQIHIVWLSWHHFLPVL